MWMDKFRAKKRKNYVMLHNEQEPDKEGPGRAREKLQGAGQAADREGAGIEREAAESFEQSPDRESAGIEREAAESFEQPPDRESAGIEREAAEGFEQPPDKESPGRMWEEAQYTEQVLDKEGAGSEWEAAESFEQSLDKESPGGMREEAQYTEQVLDKEDAGSEREAAGSFEQPPDKESPGRMWEDAQYFEQSPDKESPGSVREEAQYPEQSPDKESAGGMREEEQYPEQSSDKEGAGSMQEEEQYPEQSSDKEGAGSMWEDAQYPEQSLDKESAGIEREAAESFEQSPDRESAGGMWEEEQYPEQSSDKEGAGSMREEAQYAEQSLDKEGAGSEWKDIKSAAQSLDKESAGIEREAAESFEQPLDRESAGNVREDAQYFEQSPDKEKPGRMREAAQYPAQSPDREGAGIEREAAQHPAQADKQLEHKDSVREPVKKEKFWKNSSGEKPAGIKKKEKRKEDGIEKLAGIIKSEKLAGIKRKEKRKEDGIEKPTGIKKKQKRREDGIEKSDSIKKKEKRKDESGERKKETDAQKERSGAKSGSVSDEIVCRKCGAVLSRSETAASRYICVKCGYYFRVRTNNRIKMAADAGTFEPWFEDTAETNPLDFPGYEENLSQVQEKTGLREGVTVGYARIGGEPVVLGVCDARFLMGSMGHVVGEKITLAVEKATAMRLPVILFCCSGGARMQEGIISLMQMSKTAAALKKHSDMGLLYVPVLTDPTTGGVTASFAMLGDIILAEPGALIGFAGPRVIEQTIGERLPEGFQRAEFQLEHGFVDAIVERKDLKQTLALILKYHHSSWTFQAFAAGSSVDARPDERSREHMVLARDKTAWDKVKAARQVTRPSALNYIELIFDDFMEFHGDRQYRDDPAVVGGAAFLDGQPVTVIGIQKGMTIEECRHRNFGMSSPEGYRKALRLMRQAEKFHRPVITFVNTSGAFCGMEAEELGQGEAIARNLYEMSALKAPIICIMIGEGGSGGALALAVGNQVWMMENATYSVLSPEGFASILWKDSSRAQEAAEVMKITAQDLYSLQVVEQIIPEYGGADEITVDAISRYIKQKLKEYLTSQAGRSGEDFARERYDRFRRF